MGEEKQADPEKKVTIEPTLNGPYLVSGLTDFINSKGKRVDRMGYVVAFQLALHLT